MKHFTLLTLILLGFLTATSAHSALAANSLNDGLPEALTELRETTSEVHRNEMTGITSSDFFEEFILICMPPIEFTSVRTTYPDGTVELYDATTIQQDAQIMADAWISVNYPGFIHGQDYNYGDYTAPELCGNPGNLIIVFNPETAPQFCVLEILWKDQIKQLNCPENLTLTEGSSNLTDIQSWLSAVTVEAYVSSANFTVTNNFNASTMLAPGTYTITFTIRDCLQHAVRTCQRTLTIEAVQVDLPLAVCQDITLELDAGGIASLTPDMIDGGSSNGTLSVDISQFSCNNLGDNLVTLTVTGTSNSSLTATCTATVSVVDNSLPDFGKGNTSIRATITEGEEYTLDDLSLQFPATDNCGGALTYTQSPPAGTIYTTATTGNIILGVEDASGNYAEIPVKFTQQVRKYNPKKGGGKSLSAGSSGSDTDGSLKSASLENSPSGIGDGMLRTWPNPFSNRLYFQFIPAENSHALLEIYSVSGQKIETLIDRPVKKDQPYSLEFTPADRSGTLYLYRLQLGNYSKSGKIIRNP